MRLARDHPLRQLAQVQARGRTVVRLLLALSRTGCATVGKSLTLTLQLLPLWIHVIRVFERDLSSLISVCNVAVNVSRRFVPGSGDWRKGSLRQCLEEHSAEEGEGVIGREAHVKQLLCFVLLALLP